MREYGVLLQTSPILYRYADWSTTAPLHMIEFYLILSAVQHNISSMIFFRLLIGTVIMLVCGYLGESSMLPALDGFALGLAGWFYILYEIFAGEAGNVSASGQNVNKHAQQSFKTMRFIVSVGWCIYPPLLPAPNGG